MKQIKLLICLFPIILISYPSISEPFVVLEYRGKSQNYYENSDNMFLKDSNYHTKHTVLKNETLSDIMLKFYGTKSFNKNVLSLGIVHFNKHAFVRSNPNFLFSGKQLYLPSINEIKNLIIKKRKINNKSDYKQDNLSAQIYFFGG